MKGVVNLRGPLYLQIRLSKIFQWYKEDFGSNNEEVK